ncbi:MAG: hypothetical protein CK548_03545 [Opitutia bacterium]|nr:MAG: hypothetical protein CK548_03545 [Opitutae bacterium]
MQFGDQGRYTLDLYHEFDYLTAAAPDPAHAKPFVDPLREALRASDHPSVFAVVRPREEPLACPDEQAPSPRPCVTSAIAPTNSTTPKP